MATARTELSDAQKAALARYTELRELDLVPDPRSKRDRFRVAHVQDMKGDRFVSMERQRLVDGGWATVASFRIMESQVAGIAESLTWAANQF